jgi:hypothetical protein
MRLFICALCLMVATCELMSIRKSVERTEAAIAAKAGK